MVDRTRILYSLPPHLLAWAYTAVLVLQLILAFAVFRDPKVPGS